jgi:hypothetical protein
MADACFLTDRHEKVLNFEIIHEGIFNCSSNLYISSLGCNLQKASGSNEKARGGSTTIILQIKGQPESLMQICHLSWYNMENNASIIMTEKDLIDISMLVDGCQILLV